MLPLSSACATSAVPAASDQSSTDAFVLKVEELSRPVAELSCDRTPRVYNHRTPHWCRNRSNSRHRYIVQTEGREFVSITDVLVILKKCHVPCDFHQK